MALLCVVFLLSLIPSLHPIGKPIALGLLAVFLLGMSLFTFQIFVVESIWRWRHPGLKPRSHPEGTPDPWG